MGDLLASCGIPVNKLPLVAAGVLPFEQSYRQYLGDLFDPDRLLRAQLERKLEELQTKHRYARNKHFSSFDEMEARAQATALLEKVKDRRKLLMKLLSDPEADIDEKESKQMFAEYKEKSTAIIRHPKHVDAVIAKASKLMARELREVDELMLKFATNVEARKLGVPTATMKEHILEQKRNLIKREISNGSSIVYKNGRIFFEGDLAKSKEPVHKMGKSHNGRETKRYH